MQELNVLYVHGYQSSSLTKTADYIRAFLPKIAEDTFSNVTILSPSIPESPEVAIPFIEQFVSENKINCVVGSSLGGFNVINCVIDSNIPKIVINPLVDSMYIYNVELKNPLVELTQTIYKRHLVEFLLPKKQNIFAVFATNDMVLNYAVQSKRLRFFYGCHIDNMVFVDDAHSLTPENMETIVCPLIMMACGVTVE